MGYMAKKHNVVLCRDTRSQNLKRLGPFRKHSGSRDVIEAYKILSGEEKVDRNFYASFLSIPGPGAYNKIIR